MGKGFKFFFYSLDFGNPWKRENQVVLNGAGVHFKQNDSPFTIYIGHLYFGCYTVEGQA